MMAKYHRLATKYWNDDGTLRVDGPPHPMERTPLAVDYRGLTAFSVDMWALNVGNCNGPQCVDCGMRKCHHCHTSWFAFKDCEGSESDPFVEFADDPDFAELVWESDELFKAKNELDAREREVT